MIESLALEILEAIADGPLGGLEKGKWKSMRNGQWIRSIRPPVLIQKNDGMVKSMHLNLNIASTKMLSVYAYLESHCSKNPVYDRSDIQYHKRHRL
jgi:hypothetical protein